jgi:E3 ubiquitin-protein ligase UBR7
VIVLQYPKDEEGEPLYDELVCQACVPRCSFISQYPKALIPPSSVLDDVSEDPVQAVEPVTSRGNTENNAAGLPYLNGTERENVTPIVAQAEPSNAEISGECVVDCKLGTITEQKQTSTLHHLQKATSNGPSCLSTLDEVAEGTKPEPVGPFFLSSGWRAQLCQCPHCLNMYEEKGVSFLLDRDDTMQEYEATGKRKREEALARSEGAESNFMQKMGHIEQIEILRGLNEMTSGLQAFLVSPLPWKPMFSESWGERLVIC